MPPINAAISKLAIHHDGRHTTNAKLGGPIGNMHPVHKAHLNVVGWLRQSA
jgi:hypothetical protein